MVPAAQGPGTHKREKWPQWGNQSFTSDASDLQSEGCSERRGDRAACASFAYKEILIFLLIVAVNRQKNSF